MNAIEENKSEIPEILSVITYPNSILKEISKEIEIIDSMNEIFLNLLSKKTTKTSKKDLAHYIFTPKDTKIAADLLFSLGLVDHVIDEF